MAKQLYSTKPPARRCSAVRASSPARSSPPSAQRAATSILDKKFGSPTITKDGVTVAKEIDLEIPTRTWAPRWSRKSPQDIDVAGDGTTTATVLAESHLSRGLKNVTAGANPIASSAASRRPSDAIVATARRDQHASRTPKEIARSRPFRQLGRRRSASIIADAMDKVGKDGTITVEEAKVDRDHARRRRRHAVRQGLPLPLLRDRSRLAWKRAREPATS